MSERQAKLDSAIHRAENLILYEQRKVAYDEIRALVARLWAIEDVVSGRLDHMVRHDCHKCHRAVSRFMGLGVVPRQFAPETERYRPDSSRRTNLALGFMHYFKRARELEERIAAPAEVEP